MPFIVQIKFKTGERWEYAYYNGLGNIVTDKRKAHRFNHASNAQDFARLLTKNTKYEGRVKHVD